MGKEDTVFNSNLYGVIITILTFVIAVVLTMRQVEQTGVHVELIIRPVTVTTLGKEQPPKTDANKAQRLNPEGSAYENSSQSVTVGQRQQRTQ
jgi:hypothetical protein